MIYIDSLGNIFTDTLDDNGNLIKRVICSGVEVDEHKTEIWTLHKPGEWIKETYDFNGDRAWEIKDHYPPNPSLPITPYLGIKL
jgi:hypothetical protein